MKGWGWRKGKGSRETREGRLSERYAGHARGGDRRELGWRAKDMNAPQLGGDDESAGTVDDDAIGRGQRKAAEIGAVRSEDLDAVVAVIHDDDLAFAIDAEAERGGEATGVFARAAEGETEDAMGIEGLHAVIARVGHKDVAVAMVDRDVRRVPQLARPASFGSEAGEEDALRVKDLHALVGLVHHEDAIRGVNGDAAGGAEL